MSISLKIKSQDFVYLVKNKSWYRFEFLIKNKVLAEMPDTSNLKSQNGSKMMSALQNQIKN